MPRRLRLAAVLAVAVAGAAAGAELPVEVRPGERILFLGDSLTVHTPTSFTTIVEAAMRSRLPAPAPAFFNRGAPGEIASLGLARFDRTVAPARPTLVFILYGLNDILLSNSLFTESGGGTAVERCTASLAGLVRAVRRIGARPVLLTPPAIDPSLRKYQPQFTFVDPQGVHYESERIIQFGDSYMADLTRLAGQIRELGSREGVPVIDLFAATSEAHEKLMARALVGTLTLEGIHPNDAGHLVIAQAILERLGLPSSPAAASPINRTWTPPVLPLYVPPAARFMLDQNGFEPRFNGMTLALKGLEAESAVALLADGRLLAVLPGATLAAGLDPALLEAAPWTVRARALDLAVDAWHAADEAGWTGTRPAGGTPPALSAPASPAPARLEAVPLPGWKLGKSPLAFESWADGTRGAWQPVGGTDCLDAAEAPGPSTYRWTYMAGREAARLATPLDPPLDLLFAGRLTLTVRADAAAPADLVLGLRVTDAQSRFAEYRRPVRLVPGRPVEARFKLEPAAWRSGDGEWAASILQHATEFAFTLQTAGAAAGCVELGPVVFLP